MILEIRLIQDKMNAVKQLTILQTSKFYWKSSVKGTFFCIKDYIIKFLKPQKNIKNIE